MLILPLPNVNRNTNDDDDWMVVVVVTAIARLHGALIVEQALFQVPRLYSLQDGFLMTGA